jgi:hypothetical protein
MKLLFQWGGRQSGKVTSNNTYTVERMKLMEVNDKVGLLTQEGMRIFKLIEIRKPNIDNPSTVFFKD